ncbi:tRNA pseudouridine(55) synthase [hydrothermal vent metagenome]|uniref:tRNA pseudouridine(55) synthase n=1 Tax=hydrothermal vent metagenome TaxID=652676 RepID=A0A3B0REC9_9ZZZZ
MSRRKKGRDVSGWMVLDKGLGISSNHALGKARWLMNAKKVGHAGTLDPLATGVLPLAFGEATKTIPFIMDASKEYEFTILFGSSTDTLDAEGKETASSDARPDREAMLAVLPKFLGKIEQIPPIFSAIHVNGERAYKLAREGKAVELSARTVEVLDLQLLADTPGHSADFALTCGKGTYVRSLARDICAALAVEGHVSALRRTRVGPFCQTAAITLDELEVMVHKAPAYEPDLPVETALADIPALALTKDQAQNVSQGRAIQAPAELIATSCNDAMIVAKTAGTLLALMQLRDGDLYPFRVFNLV